MQIKQSSAPRWHAITPWRSGGGRPAAAANPPRSLLLDRFIKGEPAALTLAVAPVCVQHQTLHSFRTPAAVAGVQFAYKCRISVPSF